MLSGYKSHELGIFDPKHQGVVIIKKAIEQKLRTFLDEGLESVFISGQLGVEMWAAEVVFELKNEYPDLKLAVITPFLEQEKNWNDHNKEYYQSILSRADVVKSTSEDTYKGPWQFKKRDDSVLNYTDAALFVYDDEKEGSPKFLKEKTKKYAEKTDYNIYTIDMYELQTVAEEEQEKMREDW
jgi:uncharacterized phage-like protein YoqJ